MGAVQAGGDLSAGGEELPSDLDGKSTGGGGERKQPLSMTALISGVISLVDSASSNLCFLLNGTLMN